MDMYSDSGEDDADDKPLHVNTTEEQANQEAESKAKQRKANGEPVSVDDVTVSVEDEPMSDADSEHCDQVDEDMDADDSVLIKEEKPVDQSTEGKVKQPSPVVRPKKPKVAESSKETMCCCKNNGICRPRCWFLFSKWGIRGLILQCMLEAKGNP